MGTWSQINEVNSPTSLFEALPGSFYLLPRSPKKTQQTTSEKAYL
jgi:hypothetical protein